MGCKNCKEKKTKTQKNNSKEKKLYNPVKSNINWVNWLILFWSLIGLYGFYCLIKNLLSLI